ncbi:MAG TPA: single-stranded-DNA-specific exonuclease RecJ [Candidatus Dojkabacteria bacterium]|nr:single-stranded-DNA-specific exonuclease RecJ [Candidatus Dojkabacteria bacterium]
MTLESKRKWILPTKVYGVENVVESILRKRNITDTEKFFSSDPKDIPSPSKLHNTDLASKKILEHIEKNSKIVIHGDFDCDGICATSILWDFLYRDLSKYLGKKVDVVPYIPSRIDQGYGLTKSSLEDILNLGGDLVISVDCGVRDFDLIAEYRKKGLDFVVTDHHQPPSNFPKRLSYPLVHQAYPKHEYPYSEICGSAVAFLLVQRIKELVGMDGGIDENTKGLDLVGLATVSDIMPLTGVNRIFVKLGLTQMRKGSRKGLNYLISKAKIDAKMLNSYHLGYVIAPRINASGRIGSAIEGVKLLVSESNSMCEKIALDLERLNLERQKMTEDILNNSQKQLDENDLGKIIFVLGEDWHEGVIGLVAGKLLEMYHRPVLVTTNNNGLVKGSARSISGFNITDALEKSSNYLERYGGHELAAGFTLKYENMSNFRDSLIDYANGKITDQMLEENALKPDVLVSTDEIGVLLLDSLSKLEPFGYGNPKPVIALTELIVIKKQVIGAGKNHMKLVVKGDGIDLLTLTFFNCEEDISKINENSVIDVVGYTSANVWNGRENVEFNVREWKFH